MNQRSCMLMLNPNELTAAQAAHAIADRRLTAVQLAEACLDRIESLDEQLQAWVLLTGKPSSDARAPASVRRPPARALAARRTHRHEGYLLYRRHPTRAGSESIKICAGHALHP